MATSNRLTVSTRVYGWLIRAYPAKFRRRFGTEMTLLFNDCCRDARSTAGTWGVVRLWLRTLPDLLVTAVREQFLAIGSNRGANMIDITTFDRQLVDSIDVWEKALRMGYNVMESFELLAKKAPEPIAGEFSRLIQEMQDGVDFNDAANHWLNRVPSAHLRVILETTRQQRMEGGNLADKLQAANNAIRADVGSDGWSAGVEISDE